MEKIIEMYQKSSDEMLRSLKEDKLEKSERDEWYGYMRGVRDCAFEAGILSKTTIQKNLEEALKMTQSKKCGDSECKSIVDGDNDFCRFHCENLPM